MEIQSNFGNNVITKIYYHYQVHILFIFYILNTQHHTLL